MAEWRQAMIPLLAVTCLSACVDMACGEEKRGMRFLTGLCMALCVIRLCAKIRLI